MKLVDRQIPAFQNQDDRQAGIFGRHLPAAGRQIRALSTITRPEGQVVGNFYLPFSNFTRPQNF